MSASVADVGWGLLEHDFLFLAGLGLSLAVAGAKMLFRWQRRRHALGLQAIEKAARGMTDRELELASKLLQTLHLSVAERQELPDGRLRLSVMVTAARTDLARDYFLPSNLRPSSTFSGAILELRDDSYWVHKQHEMGVGRHGPTVSILARDVEEAVRQYVTVHGGSGAEPRIDGVPIDMRA